MSDLCRRCHWEADRRPVKTKRHGTVKYICNNILSTGWDYCIKNGFAPAECADFCEKGKYDPMAECPELVEVIKAVEVVSKC